MNQTIKYILEGDKSQMIISMGRKSIWQNSILFHDYKKKEHPTQQTKKYWYVNLLTSLYKI